MIVIVRKRHVEIIDDPARIVMINTELNESRCPECRAAIRVDDYGLNCRSCGTHYRTVRGAEREP